MARAMPTSSAAPTAANAAPKDKANKRFLVRNIVEQAAKLVFTMNHDSTGCDSVESLNQTPPYVVRVRSRTDRCKREPPQCFRRRDDMNKPGQGPRAPGAPNPVRQG